MHLPTPTHPTPHPLVVLQLEGAIAEQPQGRFSSTLSLPALCDCLLKAAYDPRIVGVVVKIDPLACGWGKLQVGWVEGCAGGRGVVAVGRNAWLGSWVVWMAGQVAGGASNPCFDRCAPLSPPPHSLQEIRRHIEVFNESGKMSMAFMEVRTGLDCQLT